MEGKIILIADKLLCQGVSFDEISVKTGWSLLDITDYVRYHFIKKYPDVYNENKAYFTWGMTDKERTEYNVMSQGAYLKEIKDKLVRQKSKHRTR